MRINQGGSPRDIANQLEGRDAPVDRDQAPKDVGNCHDAAVGRGADGREVVWLKPSGAGDADSPTTATLLDALSTEFGERITQFISNEVGLDPASGRLNGGTIEHVATMALVQRQVFSGVNFFLELDCSAEARTPSFRAACAQARVDPDQFDRATLKEIDSRFRDVIAQESNGNREPLTPADGERLMIRIVGDIACSVPPTAPDKQ